MAQVIIKSYQDFENYLGKEIGVSDYLEITQEQVNQFADATLDHQWIHTDPERAKVESPFQTTIAHGYLTVSLLKHFWDDIVEVQNTKAVINYGIDKFKFGEPVTVGSKVRVRVSLHSLSDLRGISKLQLKVRMEIEDKKKPAFEGLVTFLYHFK
ncbi:MAG: MaoC family dehydratase [Bacteroidetes bacterium]|nr:MaoC family dehydratase [Bacteroidota bacterium]